jgi:hypothetical protein
MPPQPAFCSAHGLGSPKAGILASMGKPPSTVGMSIAPAGPAQTRDAGPCECDEHRQPTEIHWHANMQINVAC